MKALYLLLFLLPLLVRMDDEQRTCFSCETDDDCKAQGAVCVGFRCTNEMGLFPNNCECQNSSECTSGTCHRVCEHNQGENTTFCEEDSDCANDGVCSLNALCVEETAEVGEGTYADETSTSDDDEMPMWSVAIVAILVICGCCICFFMTRRESCNECCCCEQALNCCCLIVDSL